MKYNSESLVSLGIFGLGLVAVGYAIALHSRMKAVAEKLDTSIEKIANDAEIEIPSKVIDQAVQKAVDRESYTAVRRATDFVVDDLRKEISDRVSTAVQASYDSIADDVTSAIAKNVAKIDEERLKKDVIAKAKRQIADKFDDKLDGVLEEFNGNLQNVSRIYESIAKSFSKENLLS